MADNQQRMNEDILELERSLNNSANAEAEISRKQLAIRDTAMNVRGYLIFPAVMGLGTVVGGALTRNKRGMDIGGIACGALLVTSVSTDCCINYTDSSQRKHWENAGDLRALGKQCEKLRNETDEFWKAEGLTNLLIQIKARGFSDIVQHQLNAHKQRNGDP